MPTEIYIPSHLLPIDAVQLGQFVLNIEYPEQDFHNPEALVASNPRVIKSSQASFSETFKRTNRSPAKRFLTTPVAAHYKSEGNLTAKVESASTSIHQLENPSDIFYDICKASNTEKWLKRAIGRRKKVYMIVGLQILTDAEVSSEGLQTQNQGGRLTVSSSMAIPGVAPTGGNIIQNSAELTNLQVSGGQNKSTSQDFRFVAPGEQIYAIQYRRISFKWYSRRNFEKAELEKPKWWKVHTRRS